MVFIGNSPLCFSYVRFSTPEQLKGDSLRRQLDASREYAEKNGLVLDENLTMQDLGLSAFSGEHKLKGALGQFLSHVQNGRIPAGSTLIVESLDRLSRQAMSDAIPQFMEIINAGIILVTLQDGMRYDKNVIDTNIGQLIISLVTMSRSHEESMVKSKRLGEVWKSKRKNADQKKLTAMCPAWLKLRRDRKSFQIIPGRAALIERIFDLYLAGNGVERIVKILHAENIPAWQTQKRKSVGWHTSYIRKILTSGAVIGKYQPHKQVTTGGIKRRVPVGDPIDDYYPSVISTDTFYRAQEIMAANVHKGGRMGVHNNLFAHVARCGYCGQPMWFLSKGKGQNYLICSTARRGRNGCKPVYLNYKKFEESFLKFCGQLDITAVLSSTTAQTGEVSTLKAKLQSIEGQLATIGKKKQNLDKLMTKADDEASLDYISSSLKKALADESSLKSEYQNTQAALKKANGLASRTEARIESVKQLIDYMKKASREKRIEIRGKLKHEIAQLVDRIEVFTNGLQDKVLSLSTVGTIQYEMSGDGYPVDDSDCRQVGIFFKASGFKQLYFKSGKWHLGISGDDYFKALYNSLKQAGFEEGKYDFDTSGGDHFKALAKSLKQKR